MAEERDLLTEILEDAGVFYDSPEEEPVNPPTLLSARLRPPPKVTEGWRSTAASQRGIQGEWRNLSANLPATTGVMLGIQGGWRGNTANLPSSPNLSASSRTLPLFGTKGGWRPTAANSPSTVSSSSAVNTASPFGGMFGVKGAWRPIGASYVPVPLGGRTTQVVDKMTMTNEQFEKVTLEDKDEFKRAVKKIQAEQISEQQESSSSVEQVLQRPDQAPKRKDRSPTPQATQDFGNAMGTETEDEEEEVETKHKRRVQMVKSSPESDDEDDQRYMLSPAAFNTVMNKLGQICPNTELFADPVMHHLDRWMGPGSLIYHDAFQRSWKYKDIGIFYANPPWKRLHRVVRKIAIDKSQGVLILPERPKQKWFWEVWKFVIKRWQIRPGTPTFIGENGALLPGLPYNVWAVLIDARHEQQQPVYPEVGGTYRPFTQSAQRRELLKTQELRQSLR